MEKNMLMIIEEISKIDIGKITSDLVKIPSYSFLREQEKEIAYFIKNFFQEEGIPCKITEIEPERYNVVAVLRGSGKGKSLMLSGHMDTVPPYDMKDPFSGEIRDGKVFGRGSCDMKGPLAAMMATMAAIKRSNIALDGDLYFSGVADEEEKGKGVKYLIANGPQTDGVIVGEPTSLAIAPGHKGLEWIEVSFQGKKVHAGRQKEGINAIQMAARYISEIYNEYIPILDLRTYPVLGNPTINIGTIVGGDQPSTVADTCVIRLDRRMVPTETIEQVYGELREIGDKLHKEDCKFSCIVKDVFEGENSMAHLPFLIDEDDVLMESAKKALDDIGRDIVIRPFPAWTDAGFIANNTEAKCIVMGPGDLAVAHSADEFIDIQQMKDAARIYADIANRYCR